MLVKNWMSKDVITVEMDDAMMDAINLLREKNIRRLPVMNKGELVGIVSDRDLKRASASDATSLEIHEMLYLISKIKVSEVMTVDPLTVPIDYTIEETAELLFKNKISGVPVVDPNGKLVGIITQTDLFKALMALSGLERRGIQFAFRLEDRPGSIMEAANVIRNYGGRLASILGTYENVPEGYRRVYIRAYGIEREKIDDLVKALKEKFVLVYMVDFRENKREIYEE
ncbi:MAG: CBS domain-containing protein [Deltaproteobacteria bacterium]|nr:CBS domain-containing protein [Deltaproteobacteria bacterium]MBW2136061.1 CBS domain-containing protein [Deltaproteobacteria bacterium]